MAWAQAQDFEGDKALAPVDAAPPDAMDIAETASQWLDAFDAIGLQSAHRAIGAVPQARGPSRQPEPVSAANLAADVERARAVLAKAIAQAPLPADPQEGFAGDRDFVVRELSTVLRRLITNVVGESRRQQTQNDSYMTARDAA